MTLTVKLFRDHRDVQLNLLLFGMSPFELHGSKVIDKCIYLCTHVHVICIGTLHLAHLKVYHCRFRIDQLGEHDKIILDHGSEYAMSLLDDMPHNCRPIAGSLRFPTELLSPV